MACSLPLLLPMTGVERHRGCDYPEAELLSHRPSANIRLHHSHQDFLSRYSIFFFLSPTRPTTRCGHPPCGCPFPVAFLMNYSDISNCLCSWGAPPSPRPKPGAWKACQLSPNIPFLLARNRIYIPLYFVF